MIIIVFIDIFYILLSTINILFMKIRVNKVKKSKSFYFGDALYRKDNVFD